MHRNLPVHIASAPAHIAYRRDSDEAGLNKSFTVDGWRLANVPAEGDFILTATNVLQPCCTLTSVSPRGAP